MGCVDRSTAIGAALRFRSLISTRCRRAGRSGTNPPCGSRRSARPQNTWPLTAPGPGSTSRARPLHLCLRIRLGFINFYPVSLHANKRHEASLVRGTWFSGQCKPPAAALAARGKTHATQLRGVFLSWTLWRTVSLDVGHYDRGVYNF